jgi:hypothetical protein
MVAYAEEIRTKLLDLRRLDAPSAEAAGPADERFTSAAATARQTALASG